MNAVNKTLYIPLYGKAYVSRRGLLLQDPKAEEIWQKEGFALRGKAASRFLAYSMAMRSRVFDEALAEALEKDPDAVVLHLGCGMDSRVLRVENRGSRWYDVDFPAVIEERSRYFRETDCYRMIGGDVSGEAWMQAVPQGESAVVVMEGLSMYLPRQALKDLLGRLRCRFERITVLMDCYSEFAAKASRHRNPINSVGVTQVYGLDDPKVLEEGTGLSFVREWDMWPESLCKTLPGWDKKIFSGLYAGNTARKLYRMYEFRG